MTGFARQVRGHLRAIVSPSFVGAIGVVGVAIAVRARTSEYLLHGSAATEVSASLPGATRVALLQMGTLVGLGICAATAAVLAEALSSARGEAAASLLEPSAARRWAVRLTAVLLASAGALLVITALTFGLGAVQALRSGAPASLDLSGWRPVTTVLAQTALVILVFAAIGVAASGVLRATPAVATIAVVAIAQAAMMVDYLLGDVGTVVIPTAWIARWLQLPARDIGVLYVWTTGADPDGRALAGLGVAMLGVLAAIAGLWVTRRSARL